MPQRGVACYTEQAWFEPHQARDHGFVNSDRRMWPHIGKLRGITVRMGPSPRGPAGCTGHTPPHGVRRRAQRPDVAASCILQRAAGEASLLTALKKQQSCRCRRCARRDQAAGSRALAGVLTPPLDTPRVQHQALAAAKQAGSSGRAPGGRPPASTAELLGARRAGAPAAVALPLVALSLLYLGPLLHLATSAEARASHPTLAAISQVIWGSNGGSGSSGALRLQLLRDLVVAPASEEWAFRACMVPLLWMAVRRRRAQGACGRTDAASRRVRDAALRSAQHSL